MCAVSLPNTSYPFSLALFYDPVHLSENRIVRGFNHFTAIYKKKLFCFASLETLCQFLKYPLIYSKMKLPRKINKNYSQKGNLENINPSDFSLDSKPGKMAEYDISPAQLKSNLTITISQILGTICNKKQKFPFLSSRESALKLLALELAKKNPKIDPTFRELLLDRKNEFARASQLFSKLKDLYKIKDNWSKIDCKEFISKVQKLIHYQKNTVIYKKREFFDHFFLKNTYDSQYSTDH